jgi:hypothetical protein
MKMPAISGRLGIGLAMGMLALGGCRARDNDPGPGGVTVGEARALDEAANMLESRQVKPATASPTPKAVPARKP